MTEHEVWRASLASLRRQFEKAASDYVSVRCSLTRESFEHADGPVAAAALKDRFSFEGLRPVIGAQVDGINSLHSGQISRGHDFYTWWFVHERLLRAKSSARISPDLGQEVYLESRRATECEQRFLESAEEGGRLLKGLSIRRQLYDLLGLNEPFYGALLWLVYVLYTARRRPAGTALRTSVTLPRIVDVDVIAATGNGKLPDSVILNLDGNPFSASVATIDLLLAADTKTDNAENFKRTLPRDPEIFKAAKFVIDRRKLMKSKKIPATNLREVLSEYANGNMKRVATLARQLQPSRYGWLLEISDDDAH